MVQKVFGICETKIGTKLVNCRKPEEMGTKEFGDMMNIIQILEEARVPAQERKKWRIEGEKKRIAESGERSAKAPVSL